MPLAAVASDPKLTQPGAGQSQQPPQKLQAEPKAVIPTRIAAQRLNGQGRAPKSRPNHAKSENAQHPHGKGGIKAIRNGRLCNANLSKDPPEKPAAAAETDAARNASRDDFAVRIKPSAEMRL